MSGHWQTPLVGTLVTCDRCCREVHWERCRRWTGEWGNVYYYCDDCTAKAHDDQEAAFRERYGDAGFTPYQMEGR